MLRRFLQIVLDLVLSLINHVNIAAPNSPQELDLNNLATLTV